MFQDSFIANETLKDVFNPLGRFGGGWFKRYFLNLTSGSLRVEDIFDHECEFPTFNSSYVGTKNEITYAACSIDNGSNSFFNGMARISGDGHSDVIELEPGYYGSEPMFAPSTDSKNEGTGICWLSFITVLSIAVNFASIKQMKYAVRFVFFSIHIICLINFMGFLAQRCLKLPDKNNLIINP